MAMPETQHSAAGFCAYGYCAAKQMRYYGFKMGLRISRIGMIVHYPLLPADLVPVPVGLT